MIFSLRLLSSGMIAAFQAVGAGSIPAKRTRGLSSNQVRTKSLYGFYPGSNPGKPISRGVYGF